MKDWSLVTTVVLGAGPSLTDEQVLHVRNADFVRVITVNVSYQKAPWADVFYGGDYLFYKVHYARMKAVAFKHVEMWTQDNAAAERWQINRIRGVNREGLGHSDIHMGGNSGYQAINLAFLWGCKRILLLGMDMRLGPHGEKHWHGDHEEPLVQRQTFDQWLLRFEKMAIDLKAVGVSVVNCTPGSALTCFPMSDIGEEMR
jgi:hypothetical protein